MESMLKKTLKLISNDFELKYEDLKNCNKKYLKAAKSYDKNLYSNINELIELNDISSTEELDEYDIEILKMYCKLRDIDHSGSDSSVRKRLAEYFEDYFEDLEYTDSEESDEEPDSDPEESEVESEIKPEVKKVNEKIKKEKK